MSLAVISLIALGLVILASTVTRVNPGVLAIVLAWIIGVYVAPFSGDAIPVREILAGFPSSLFLTLVAVTLLFTQASVNGTLDKVAAVAVRWCRGNAGVTPIMFFALAFVFSSVGAGNIAAAALISPMAMATASRARIPAFLMVIAVGHGALAGALSPISPTGVIAGGLMREQLGLAGFEWAMYLHNMVANAVVGVGGYLLLGGWRLFGRASGSERADRLEPDEAALGGRSVAGDGPPGAASGMTPTHWITLGVIAALVVGVIGFGVDVGMGAFAGSVVLALARLADPEAAVRRMPWGVMLMVCGITVLTSMLQRTGGSQLITDFVGGIAGPESVSGIIAFLSGIISVYSSTSGVVLPAFLPMVGGIASAVGGDPLAVASSMIVGGHLVDSSPLSTIGALAIASAPPEEDRHLLFTRVLAWGLSMSVVGAVYCYVFFGLLA